MTSTNEPGPTRLSAKQRQLTDDRVCALLEESGVMSVEQLVAKTKFARSTVKLSVERLRKDGVVRKLPKKRACGRRGIFACVYELGCEEDLPIRRAPVKFAPFRHPQDIAFFGLPKTAVHQREAA